MNVYMINQGHMLQCCCAHFGLILASVFLCSVCVCVYTVSELGTFSQDVLYTICNNCGPVQRIVIFRKNGVQAMVEYPFPRVLSECLLQVCFHRKSRSLTVIEQNSG